MVRRKTRQAIWTSESKNKNLGKLFPTLILGIGVALLSLSGEKSNNLIPFINMRLIIPLTMYAPMSI